MGQMMMTFKRPDGKECAGFCVEPGGANRAPAVVVIQEWWGLNDQIKGVANKLCAAGYRALVPDLYRGKIGLDAKEAEHLMGGLDFADAATQDIQGAVNFLRESSSKVGVTGFCMGGALTVLAACNVPEASAMVCWYGVPPLDYVDATRIHAPLMGHFAIDDAFFPIGQVDGLEQKLKQAGKDYEFFRYKAQHAFANETLVSPAIAARYDAAAASTAWMRTMEFFGRHLNS